MTKKNPLYVIVKRLTGEFMIISNGDRICLIGLGLCNVLYWKKIVKTIFYIKKTCFVVIFLKLQYLL